MGKVTWTPLHDRYLRRYYPATDREVIALKLGKSVQAIKARANKLMIKKQSRKNNYKRFTDLELRYVRLYYPKGDTAKMAERLGIKITVLYQKALAMGVKRDANLVLERNRELGRMLAASDNGHRFKSGHVSHNAGKKQSEFMTAEAIARTAATRFKKGQDPHNTKPIGSERITIDGYTEVKVRHTKDSQKNYELKHRVVYAEKYGPIPDGMIIEFVDGDTQNFAPENLRAVTRIENVRNNGLKDSAIVKRVFKERDPEKIKEIAAAHPEVIELKRTVIKVNAALRDHKKQTNGTLGKNSRTGTPGQAQF